MNDNNIERCINYAECIIENNQKYLMILRPTGVHAGGSLAYPGGKIDKIDSKDGQDVFLQTAKREVLEEVGIILNQPLSYVTSNFFYDDKNNIPVVGCVFYCKLIGERPIVIPNLREVPEYYWLTFEEINAHPKSPEWAKRYLSILKNIK